MCAEQCVGKREDLAPGARTPSFRGVGALVRLALGPSLLDRVVATDTSELPRLADLRDRAARNSVAGVTELGADEFAEIDSIVPRLYLTVRLIQELSRAR